jgi:hypothetical protein
MGSKRDSSHVAARHPALARCYQPAMGYIHAKALVAARKRLWRSSKTGHPRRGAHANDHLPRDLTKICLCMCRGGACQEMFGGTCQPIFATGVDTLPFLQHHLPLLKKITMSARIMQTTRQTKLPI